MHTNVVEQPNSDAFLRTAFRFNAAFGALSGVVFMLASGWPPLSVPGKWMVAGLAEIVAVFAILQTIGIRKKGV